MISGEMVENRVKQNQRYAVFMRQLHNQVCKEQGEHPDEVDTAYSVAAMALDFQARVLSKSLADLRNGEPRNG